MKNTIQLLLGTIILIIIIAGAYSAFGSGGFSITGAFTGAKECVTDDTENFYNACVQWKERGYEDRPSTLKVLTEESARTTCDKVLSQYKEC